MSALLWIGLGAFVLITAAVFITCTVLDKKDSSKSE